MRGLYANSVQSPFLHTKFPYTSQKIFIFKTERMTELYINGELADISLDLGIVLCKEFTNDDVLGEKSAEFSYEFDLPTSETNKRIFGHVDTLDVPRKFTTTKDCRIYEGGVLLLDGKIVVNSVDSDSFHCNAYKPAQKSLNDIFGELKLNEITPRYERIGRVSDYLYLNNQWLGGHDNLIFPYINYSGYAFNKVKDPNNRYEQSEENNLRNDNIFPALHVQSIVKDIFSSRGLEVEGNFFNSNYFKDIFQTIDNDKFADLKNDRNYIHLSFDYDNKDSNTILSYDNEGATMCSDNILTSGAMRNVNLYDTNELVAETKDDNGNSIYNINIPKSGWYSVKYTVNWEDTSAGTSKNGLPIVYGSDIEWRSPYELHLTTDAEATARIMSYTQSEPFNTNVKRTIGQTIGTKGQGKFRFPRNNYQNTYTGLEPQGLLNGIRWGRILTGLTDSETRSGNTPNAWLLPNPSKTSRTNGVYHNQNTYEYSFKGNVLRGGTYHPDEMTDYGESTAFAFSTSKNAPHSGYAEYDPNIDTWSVTQQKIVNGMSFGSAYKKRGDVRDLCYLRKGDNLYIQMISPWDLGGAVGLSLHFDMEFQLINTEDEYWDVNSTVIPSFTTISPMTNINLLLGNESVNSWLQNLCKTFNLKVTRNGEKYSIDYDDKFITTNTICLDEYAHPSHAVAKRIQIPTFYSFKWQYDSKEAGYRLTQSDGSLSFANDANTSGEEKQTDSKYAYTWMHDITYNGKTYNVPIIAKEEVLEGSWSPEKDTKQGSYKGGKPRLLKVPRTATRVIGLPIPKAVEWSDVVERMFSVVSPERHDVELECYLPTSVFYNINQGTLVRFNDNLYTIFKIDDYDCSGDDPCKITLRSL